jgi:hypothetical protein
VLLKKIFLLFYLSLKFQFIKPTCAWIILNIIMNVECNPVYVHYYQKLYFIIYLIKCQKENFMILHLIYQNKPKSIQCSCPVKWICNSLWSLRVYMKHSIQIWINPIKTKHYSFMSLCKNCTSIANQESATSLFSHLMH